MNSLKVKISVGMENIKDEKISDIFDKIDNILYLNFD